MALMTLCAAAALDDVSALGRAAGLAHVSQGRRQRPSQPSAEDARADAYIDEGQRHADEGDWAAALKSFEQAAAASPRRPDAHIYVGDAYMSLGKSREAFNAYREAIRVAPTNAEAHYSLGVAYNDMAMYGDAFAPFVRAIGLDPGHAEANYGIGYAYLKLENFKDAVVYLKRAIRLRNDYPDAQLSLGLAYVGMGQTNLAEEQLKVLEGMDALLAKELEKEIRRAVPTALAARPESGAGRPTAAATPRPEATAESRRREPVGQAPQAAARTPRREAQTPESVAPTSRLRPPRADSTVLQPRGSASNLADELNLWDRIKNSTDPADFDAYLRDYPEGEFAGLARIRLRVLKSQGSKRRESGAAPRPEAAPAPPRTAAAAVSEESAPQSSAEAQRGPTTKETLSLLKKAFANKLTYTITAPGEDANVVKVTYEVVIEYEPLSFDTCRVEWRDRKDTLSVALSDLDPLGIKVEPRSKPNTTFSIPVWSLSLKTMRGVPAIRALKGDGSGNSYSDLDLQFADKEKAERLARLLLQAVILCKSSPQ
jgi:Tfp pilus assembly protein PilF